MKKYISILLILISISFVGCSEEQVQLTNEMLQEVYTQGKDITGEVVKSDDIMIEGKRFNSDLYYANKDWTSIYVKFKNGNKDKNGHVIYDGAHIKVDKAKIIGPTTDMSENEVILEVDNKDVEILKD